MRLSLKPRPNLFWDFPDQSRIEYRLATTLDRDIATTAAAGYIRDLVNGTASLADFGQIAPDAAALVEMLGSDSDDLRPWSNHLYAVALAERCVIALHGFECEDAEGEIYAPTPTRRILAVLFQDADIQRDWVTRAHAKIHEQAAAGNAFGALSVTNTDQAPKIAKAAPTSAKPAPQADSAPMENHAAPALNTPSKPTLNTPSSALPPAPETGTPAPADTSAD